MDPYQQVKEKLDELGISFDVVEHPPAFTTEQADSYIEGLEGSRFVVQNPNATTTCGCGSSFSI